MVKISFGLRINIFCVQPKNNKYSIKAKISISLEIDKYRLVKNQLGQISCGIHALSTKSLTNFSKKKKNRLGTSQNHFCQHNLPRNDFFEKRKIQKIIKTKFNFIFLKVKITPLTLPLFLFVIRGNLKLISQSPQYHQHDLKYHLDNPKYHYVDIELY